MKKILVILGPTSTGKTDIALQLSSKFQGELVSVDSRQVYRGLDIGTGKLPGQQVAVKKGKGFWEMDGIKVWMYDVVDVTKRYTVYEYVRDANQVVDDIFKRGKLPIVVGGTGLYLKALLEGLSNLSIPIDRKLRKELESLSLADLQKKLQKVSPQRWEKMNNSDRQNPRRLIRAIEIASTDFTSEESLRATIRGGFKTLKIGLTAPREILYKRIDERVVSRIDQGMINEAEKLHKHGLSFKRMRELGLEYGVLADYLQGKIKTQDELIRVLQWKIHGYARRQITWFEKETSVYWFDIRDKDYLTKLDNLVTKWYDNPRYVAKN